MVSSNVRLDVCIRCVGVGVADGKCQSEGSFVCFGAKPTHRACARDLQRDRKRTKEGKMLQTSPFLRLGPTQVRVFYSLFFHPLARVCCVLCVYKEM